ncbi:ATP-binding protein [Microbispora hainanensis]|uniref:DNA mismatch repair protein n=1 Tax=Microbispora hainanensis TaxID=568844 RepID=A0A544Y165_9ACTN|nr:ATP-binding protein [Microbispora hainanensis]TQS10510.1 DNA mismatch repair protein [Microbispora hainanensis]
MSDQHVARQAASSSPESGVLVPPPAIPHATEILLEVGEPKILQFARKPQIAAIAELVWNALDANATSVRVELRRAAAGAIDEIVVVDNGHGITPEQARQSFREYGATWKSRRTHTEGGLRILHGRMGEGRLYVFALGTEFSWESVALVDGQPILTRITADVNHATKWHIDEPVATTASPGTTVRIYVPDDKRLRPLEAGDAAANLTAKLAFYLKAYPETVVEFDGTRLDPDQIIEASRDLELELPEEYAQDNPPPFVTFVEWKERMSDRKMLICNSDGIALAEYGDDWSDSVVSFTPYLRSNRFNDLPVAELHMLTMTHSALIDSAEKAVRNYLRERSSEISAQVIRQLKEEGIYPYSSDRPSATELVERQTFDVVVTVARNALPQRGAARKLSVNLIRSALESSPGDLQEILDSVLSLSNEDRANLARLLVRTELSDVIGAAATVTNRLDFISGLRRIFADDRLRAEFREVDQLHPMIAQNLWLFGEEWTLARPEVGLTAVLSAHLSLLGEDAVLENGLDAVLRDDGRSGRVDIVLFRGIGDERSSERLIIELKRPSVIVGREEVEQVKSYARAIVDNPQYRGAECKWRFYLVTYEFDNRILRDIRQQGKPPGLADDQPEYEVWVKSWGEILDAAERKLSFFRRQLNYEATDERVIQHLLATYERYIPESIRPSAPLPPPAAAPAAGSSGDD